MISLKRFLDAERREHTEAFETMAYRLLNAIGQYAVEGDRADFESFQATIEGVQAGLKKDPSPDNILVAAGSSVEALESYNRRTSQFITAKSAEFQAIVGMLAQAMAQIATGSQNSIARLQDLQKDIECAAVVEDVRTLRIRLSDCLQSIQGEVGRQRDESSRAICDLKQSLRQSQEAKPSEAVETGRAVTSLLSRLEAEAAIAAACEAKSQTYAGLFVLDRANATTARFGRLLGEQAVDFFMQHLLQGLGPNDKLFRWDDTSFLALVERSESADHVRRELGRTLARRTEHTFTAEGRSVALPISTTWLFVPLFEHVYRETLRKLDKFCESLQRA